MEPLHSERQPPYTGIWQALLVALRASVSHSGMDFDPYQSHWRENVPPSGSRCVLARARADVWRLRSAYGCEPLTRNGAMRSSRLRRR